MGVWTLSLVEKPSNSKCYASSSEPFTTIISVSIREALVPEIPALFLIDPVHSKHFVTDLD